MLREPYETAADVVAILGVPALLVGVFSLPRAVRAEYVFAYGRPTPVDALASHYVHLGVGHLAANLFWYAVLVAPAYALLARTGRRVMFRAAFVTFLTAFPLAISAVNLLLPRGWQSVAFGFSAVVMAFAGLLTVAVGGYLVERLDLTPNYVPAVFLLGAAVVVFRVLWGAAALPTAALAVAVVAAPAVPRARRLAVRSAPLRRLEPWLVVAGALALAAVLVVAFSRPTAGDTFANLLAHMLGYSFGAVVPHATVVVCRCFAVPVAPLGRAEK